MDYPLARRFEVEVRNPDVFIERLKERLEPADADDGRFIGGGLRYEIRGHAREDDIFMELVTIPSNSRYFRFAPVFNGKLTADRRRMVGRFRPLIDRPSTRVSISARAFCSKLKGG